MSLLLDALKKSGDNQHKGAGASNLTLEDVPPGRNATTSAASSSRAAGETMFAAKKAKPASFRWKLGLVPTTLLFALIFGSAYGYYVWLELQPPKQPAFRHIPPPAPQPVPHTVASAALVPVPPAPEEPAAAPEQPPVARAEQPAATPRSDEPGMPHFRARTNKPRQRPAASIPVQRQVKADTVTPKLLEAYQAYQNGDYATATQAYRDALGNDPRNRDALLGLATIAEQQGQADTARYYYRQMLLLDPRDPAAQAAMAAYAPEDGGETESRLKRLLAENPRSGALNFALGNYYAAQSSWGDAQQYYFYAHTLEPANAQFAFNLAVSLDHLGQRKVAAQFYQQALQLDVSGHSGFDHAQAQQRLNELTTH